MGLSIGTLNIGNDKNKDCDGDGKIVPSSPMKFKSGGLLKNKLKEKDLFP